MAERVGTIGRVHAVEAHPSHAHGLAQQVAAKALKQITVHAVALSNEPGIGEFVCVKTHPSRSGLRQLDLSFLAVPVETEIVQVNRMRLDDVLPTDTVSWRFCKLDLEGGEFHALMGGLSAIERHGPFIVLENGRDLAADAYGYTRDDWFAFFDRLGYAVFDLFGRPFTSSSWQGGRGIPWYCMAVGRYSQHADFIANVFPGLLRRVIEEFGEASSRYASQNWWRLSELPALKSAP
jgi:FkbM family methyltransferase